MILVVIQSILIFLSIKNGVGGGVLLHGQNLLSVMKVICQKSLKQGRKYQEGRAFCISSGYYLGLGINNLICCLSAGLNSYSAPGPDTIGI